MMYALLLFAQAPEKQPDPGPFALMPLLLIGIAFVFIILLPARRRERQQREMLNNSLKKNDEVLTAAGIIGTVANIKDEEITLKVDDNVRIRMLKSSIVKILSPKEAGKDAGTDAVKAGSPPAK